MQENLDINPQAPLEEDILTLRGNARVDLAWKRTVEDLVFNRRLEKMARRYAQVMCVSDAILPDAVNEGRIEARKAVLAWDPTRGPYLNYALSKARSGVTRCLGDNRGVVRVPATTREKLSLLRKAERGGKCIEDSKDVESILGVKDVTAQRLYRCLRGRGEVSLDAPRSADDDRPLSSVIGKEDLNFEVSIGQEEASALLKKMKDEYLTGDARRNGSRNWYWFMEYYGIVEDEDGFRVTPMGKTFEEIAKKAGVERNVVNSAVKRLLRAFQKKAYFRRFVEDLLESAYAISSPIGQ